MNIQNKLKINQSIRQKASLSCSNILKEVLQSSSAISEINFKNKWQDELDKFTDIEEGGWYNPPPDGFGVLFGKESDIERLNYPSLRPQKYWPKDNLYFDNTGLGYLYASPYSIIECIPIIGDFGFSCYLGKVAKIRVHFKKSFEVLNKLIENIKAGISFKELFRISSEIIGRNDLQIYMLSITDKAEISIGHTIPFITKDPNPKQQKDINSANPQAIHNIISRSRKFISSQEKYIISNNCAFTFEPRFISSKNSSLPMFSFHTTIQFVSGKKVVLSNMDKIINLLEMEWIYV